TPPAAREWPRQYRFRRTVAHANINHLNLRARSHVPEGVQKPLPLASAPAVALPLCASDGRFRPTCAPHRAPVRRKIRSLTMRSRALAASLLVLVLVLSSSAAVAADEPKAPTKEPQKEKDLLAHLKFRNIGPADGGGRVHALAAIPGRPQGHYDDL